MHETPLPFADLALGLSASEAQARLLAEGPNELPRQQGRSILRIAAEVLREPMLALLLGAGLVYLVLGDLHEALILVGFAGLSILITIVQETRTERALEALRDLTSPRALVVRDGERVRIAGREVVRGDLVVLTEGDRVPADGWLAGRDSLLADESLLTGESVPVRKRAAGTAPPAAPARTDRARPGGEDLPFVYSGSLVVGGGGLCVVTATGPLSEIGRIGKVLATLEPEAPRLRRQTRRMVLWFALAGGGASLLAVILYGLLRGDWLQAALAGIALGMSMLPEEFPVVLTIFLAMGAMRMSRERILTRRAAAIETLGAATVLCTDKTGTLTLNRMRVAELALPDGRIVSPGAQTSFTLEADFARLAELGILASAPLPVDPMEVALHQLDDDHAGPSLRPRQDAGWTLHRHYPLAPPLLAMSHVWGENGGEEPASGPSGLPAGERLVATKGAPEAIADLCNLSPPARAAMQAAVDAMAARGLRVLGVADATWTTADLPATQHAFPFVFRGLVGLADPLRPSVPEAVRQCRAAGIRIIMITGDYPETARAIAAQAGIGPVGMVPVGTGVAGTGEAADVLTGDELARLDDAALARRLATVAVCARIMPEQKLRLVEALKASGEIVAMTGDGVNDAPSLKAAHIGIAMGGRGSDVAREVASIVLLDDDFGSIVKAVAMGRRIYDNLRKAMGFIVAVHIPIAGIALLPLVTGPPFSAKMPLLLGPIHIAFIEMFIDPVCSLAFEAETDERDVMRRPPRSPAASLFSRWLVGWSALQGVIVLLMAGAVALWSWSRGLPDGQVRATAFLALMAGIAVLILANRRFSGSIASALRRPNPALAAVLGGVAAILAATQLIPAVAGLFAFAAPPWPIALLVAGGAAALLVVLERLKRTVGPRLLV